MPPADGFPPEQVGGMQSQLSGLRGLEGSPFEHDPGMLPEAQASEQSAVFIQTSENLQHACRMEHLPHRLEALQRRRIQTQVFAAAAGQLMVSRQFYRPWQVADRHD